MGVLTTSRPATARPTRTMHNTRGSDHLHSNHDNNLAVSCQRWGFTPCHVMVNQERLLRERPQLQRCMAPDRLAQLMARVAVQKNDTMAVQVKLVDLQAILGHRHVAQVIQRGQSIQGMLHQAMKGKKDTDSEIKQTILSFKYKEFGMGTARHPSGDIVMIQLFRGQ